MPAEVDIVIVSVGTSQQCQGLRDLDCDKEFSSNSFRRAKFSLKSWSGESSEDALENKFLMF